MRNSRLSHTVTAPCRICKTETPALVKGVMQSHPVCAECRAELDRQFRLATAQRRRTDTRGSSRAAR